jgi:hypothetical protein
MLQLFVVDIRAMILASKLSCQQTDQINEGVNSMKFVAFMLESQIDDGLGSVTKLKHVLDAGPHW